ncbi:hypothetical protein [Prescottella equi]
MSLLDRGTEEVTVYPEEAVTDMDGNIRTRPSKVGYKVRVRIQVQGQAGTSARRAEQDNEGYESEKVYRIRFPRSHTQILGAQSQIEWNGIRHALFGDANYYTGSPRTRHVTYSMKRY